MHVERLGVGILLIIALLVPALGYTPDQVLVTGDPPWVVAGSTDTSTITVTVLNHSIGIPGLYVTVSCTNPSMGFITPGTSLTTNANGIASATFTPSKMSGNAPILVTVTSRDYEFLPVTVNYTQKIDHSTPTAYKAILYPSTVPVYGNNETNVLVRLKDAYGNIVDNRREVDEHRKPESITFADSGNGDGGFWNGARYVHTIASSVNATGYFNTLYKVPSTAGDNVIQVTAPPSVTPSPTFITVRGIATVPSAISSLVTPPTKQTYADGRSTFSILYTMTDPFGNPVPNSPFSRSTNLSEHGQFWTNDEGQLLTLYGPKATNGVVNVTASAEGFPAVTVTDTLQFLPAGAVMWDLTASPQVLPSRDVKPDTTANVIAKVIDLVGNPVENEVVEFEILPGSSNANVVVPPSFDSGSVRTHTTAVTDVDGVAVVHLHPGAFPLYGQAGYVRNATGTFTVRATWQSATVTEPQTVGITYRNYPYLSVESGVTPQTISVNDTVDVTVRLLANGWALQPTPADVVLVTDLSGSMADYNKMADTKDALRQFVTTSGPTAFIGLAAFSNAPTPYNAETMAMYNAGPDMFNPYEGKTDSSRTNPRQYHSLDSNGYSDAHIDLNFTQDKSRLLTTINSYSANGGTNIAGGINAARRMFKDRGYTGHTKVMLIMSDGIPTMAPIHPDAMAAYMASDWVSDYSTIAQQAALKAAERAKSEGITVYSIGFGPDADTSTLVGIASSPTTYYFAPTGSHLATIYQEIAGQIAIAPVINDTNVLLSFGAVNVSYNNVTTDMPGNDVFDYIHVPGTSTYVTSWNATYNPLPDLLLVPPYPSTHYPYTYDQASDWATIPPQLIFYAGNISLNQVWEATFRLKAKTPGSINVFGQGSTVSFSSDYGSDSLALPDTYISAVANVTPLVTQQPTIEVKNLTCTNDHGPGSITEIMDLQWTLQYTGHSPVKQEAYYQFSQDGSVWSGSWVKFTTILTDSGPIDDTNFVARLDVRNVRGFYMIRVTAREQISGGVYDEEEYGPIEIQPPQGVIKIV